MDVIVILWVILFIDRDISWCNSDINSYNSNDLEISINGDTPKMFIGINGITDVYDGWMMDDA